MPDKIPPEILCEIFTYAIDPPNVGCTQQSQGDYIPHIEPNEVSLAPYHFLPQLQQHDTTRSHAYEYTVAVRETIRSVSKYWKDIVDGTPKFWTLIALKGHEQFSTIQTYMENSKPLPISLYLDLVSKSYHSNNLFPDHEETPSVTVKHYGRLLNLCLQSSRRLTELHIFLRCSIQTAAIIEQLPSILTCPILHTLHIHQLMECDIPGMLSVPSFPLHYPAPMLRHLTLTCLPLAMPIPPESIYNITSLDIHFRYITDNIGCHWNKLSYLLSRAPNLKILRITFAANPTIAFPTIPLSFTNLREISITLTQNHNAGAILPLFSKTIATSLSVLNRAFNTFNGESNSAFRDLFIPGTSPSTQFMIERLTTFAISWGAVDDITVTILARHLTCLENLIIQNIVNIRNGPDRLISFLLNNSIEAEMNARKLPPVQIAICCPKLASLEIKKRDPKERTADYLVYSRSRLGRPLLRYITHTH